MEGGEGVRYKKDSSKGGDAVAFSWNLTDFSGISAVEFGAGWPGKRS